MSSYDKVVKLACKPKAANPKAKYLDPIIAATWSDDGAVHDVCKALSPRFREPNAIVVFKALIVLHTMIRNGATDNVLSYLSSGDILRLRNVAAGQWEGYDAPRNVKNYAYYLDSRIRAYRDLKHDAVRVQSESNRDMRVSQSLEDSRTSSGMMPSGGGSLQRSKTLAGRKLRSMTVEKGLLRETKAVHQMIDALVQCKFYMDDLEDELTVTALRMLVKDLLVLFQAGNEGVINVLENYFEMSHIDAEEALKIYRHFCKQTEQVMDYLGVARKLENLLNVPIPHLKHAPVSLVGALEEYLNDPNFEQNRLEYKANKAATDRPSPNTTPLRSAMKKGTNGSSSPVPPVPKLDSPVVSSSPKADGKPGMVDFLDSIEKDLAAQNGTSAGPSAVSPAQASPSFNPFVQRQSVFMPMQMTGGFALQQQSFLHGQQTGFPQPQQTVLQTSPFPLQQQTTSQNLFMMSQQTGNPFQTQQSQQTSSSFLQPPQQTAQLFQQQRQSMVLQPQATGLLRPQTTGSNPFRQSMMFPNTTGAPSFAMSGNMFTQGVSLSQPPQSAQKSIFGASVQRAGSPSTIMAVPNRPQSTPIPSQQKPMQPLTAVAAHTTGTRNPFGVPVAPAPPVPKPPTLQELASGAFGNVPNLGSTGILNQYTAGNQSASGRTTMTGSPKPGVGGDSVMANVATSFTMKSGQDVNGSISATNPFPFTPSQSTPTSSSFSDFSNGITNQPTGSTAQTTAASVSSLQQQVTGFGGVKPFKPSSSFGASLLESLPPIADSPTKSPSALSFGIGNPGQTPTSNGVSRNPTGVQLPSITGLPGLSGVQSNPFGLSSNLASLNQSSRANVSGLPSSNTTNPSLNFGSGFKPTGILNAHTTGLNPIGSSSNSNAGALTSGLRPQMTGGANPFRASMMLPPNMSSFNNSPFPSNLPSSSTTTNPPFNFTPSGFNGSQLPFSAESSKQNTSSVQSGSLI